MTLCNRKIAYKEGVYLRDYCYIIILPGPGIQCGVTESGQSQISSEFIIASDLHNIIAISHIFLAVSRKMIMC